jgi:hypothetical protein
MAALVGTMLSIASAAVVPRQSAPSDPFAPIDPQNWVNPDNMTWDGMSDLYMTSTQRSC